MVQLEYCPIIGNACGKSEALNPKRDTFFLAEPFRTKKDRERREDAVKNSLTKALGSTFSEGSLQYADKEPKATAIFCEICLKIQSSEFGIVDLSGLIPNVLLELGMMLAFGKPVFLIANVKEKERIEKKLPSDLNWKRVIPYEQFIDIEKELVKQLIHRDHPKPRKPSTELKLDKEIEDYSTVKIWFSKLGTKSDGVDDERKRTYSALLEKYCRLQTHMNPDQTIDDAERDVEAHSEFLRGFINDLKKEDLKNSTIRNHVSTLRSFYIHNEVEVKSPRVNSKSSSRIRNIETTDIQKIVEVAESKLEHQSWILANSYLGLGVTQLPKLLIEDFQTGEWGDKEQRLYPVIIRKEVSHLTYDYTLYIGYDAKHVLEKYFKQFTSPLLHPWKFPHQTFSNKFKEFAGIAKLIPKEEGTVKSGAPRGYSPLPPRTFKKRLEKIFQKNQTPDNVVLHILGSSKEHDTPREGEIEHAYDKALSDLMIVSHPKTSDSLHAKKPPPHTPS
jgi:nucleoside 2-deoxyribosyltransferase